MGNPLESNAAMAASKDLTLEKLRELDDTEPASEYACGEALPKDMPNRLHAAIQFYLAMVIGTFLAQTGLGRGFTELRCIFGSPGRERTYIPDLTYVAKEHLTEDLFHQAPPDLAVEILSPDQDLGRFLSKINFYLQHGVRLVWVIDPIQQTVTVMTPDDDAIVLTAGATLDGGEILPGFRVSLEELFAQTKI
jgi:Uma2 family endonuclease